MVSMFEGGPPRRSPFSSPRAWCPSLAPLSSSALVAVSSPPFSTAAGTASRSRVSSRPSAPSTAAASLSLITSALGLSPALLLAFLAPAGYFPRAALRAWLFLSVLVAFL
eukprot:CAMPEP_0184523204 /NCGR_PEP_ID=MMETSP0198_2-20121128/8744_1 /TAXON_ID=1112570 /ORGANISM="Thraustochytrium sp., Strain LLF1b" /LENGTH=109 /DNA_ID=CAMNT_0026914189 /DNA_START=1181 /DNA_END=1507 /DNA_ORIENTATION=+